MKTLDIRSFALGIAVVAVMAIGTFVVLERSDGPAEAAPESGQEWTAPQGQGIIRDLYFECASYGITVLMNQQELANYTCHSDAEPDIDCAYNFTQNAITCSVGGKSSVCQLTTTFPDTSEASCTDSDGSEHDCFFDLLGVTCETLDPSVGKDFISCSYSSRFEPFTCGTEDGPLACLGNPEVLLTIVCQTLSSFPATLWGDLDCDAEISSRDNQALLREVLGANPLSQTEPCPNAGDSFSFMPDRAD